MLDHAMTSRLSRSLALVALAAGFVALVGELRSRAQDKKASTPKFTAAQVSFYEKEVLPVLQKNCLKCHGDDPEKLKGGLNLATRAGVLAGGETGPAVNLARPADSLLLKAIHYKDENHKMPPKGKLPDRDIATLEKWVVAGLPVSADRVGEVAKAPPKGVITEEAKRYWAYQPVKRPPVPEVKGKAWVKTPIDAFVLAMLEAKGLKPVKPAEKAVLVRRAYYDLTGLPPTPEEIDAFVNSKDADAWEKLIDRLLASPHYGEKWGRHWLDVVRYGETNGYERDGPKPFAWRYRDYVIKSFNADKPYDQFIREQLAGDEMPGFNPDAVVATGFYRLGTWDDEPADPELAVYDGYDDIIATTGQAFLAMTFNCARCHDHKGDPIPQADYYRLLAFFRDIPPYSKTRDVRSKYNLTDITPPDQRAKYEEELKKREARLAEIKKAMEAVEDEVIKTLPAEDQRAAEGPDRPQVISGKVVPALKGQQKDDYTALSTERKELEKKPAPPGQQLALSVNNCDANPKPTHLLVRGSPHAKGKEVKPGFPEVLGLPEPTIPAPKPGAKSSGRRTVLAEWIASKDNPATGRVFVNRVWQYHFGRGIVPSTNDFGKFGEAPTHPELLDWLASEFMESSWASGGRKPPEGEAWKLKRLHKLIMMSSVYQLSASADDANLKADPANALLWRFNMRRLTGEEVRDSILAVSGSLNLKQFGPSTYPKIPKEVLAGQSVPGQGWPTSQPEEANRRSVYAHVKRSLRVPILVGFDQPDPDSSCPVRYVTTVPTQSLGLLNGEFANEQAEAFARRLRKEKPNDLAAQVARAIRLTTGRVPAADEVKEDVSFVQRLKDRHKLDDEKALAQYCLLCLNANEFVYLD
jgi:mono/diheme cytochrome c family protein